ncbi:MAG TPA: hypothetical protein PLS10_07075 [Chitinophagales bacterium]|nr:hypothetical protein [Chitinophagales bacterium]
MQNGNVPDRTKIDYTPYEELARQWTNITVLRLKSSVQKKNIGATGKLLSSFMSSVNVGNGEYIKILISYLYYGKFVDMGVGKGVDMATALRGSKFKRKRKVWYSKTIGQEVTKLSFFMARKAGSQAANILLDFPQKIEM